MARTTWDAFHRQGPFVGSGGLYSPGPATAPPLSRRYERWMTLSRHPGPSPVLHRYFTAQPDSRRLFARCGRRRFTADGRSALGPRSLSPVLFWEAGSRAYLGPNVACRLLQLHYDVRALARALDSSQGRRPQPPSFSDVPRCLPCGSGEHAASRAPSAKRDPGAGSSCFHRFSRPRCPAERATGTACAARVVAIDVHGSLDRAKDASPIERCMIALRWVHTPFTRMLTAFPSSAPRGHPAVAGASDERGGDLFRRIGPA
jgi:hypothetical protein